MGAFRWALAGSFAAGLALIGGVLARWAGVEVRSDDGQWLLFTLLGLPWLVLAALGSHWLGISPSDDAVDARNPAALLAVSGALLGASLIYAGSICAATYELPSLAVTTLPWFGAWALLGVFSKVSSSVSLERDLPSGLRLGVFLLVAGALLGHRPIVAWRDAWPLLASWFTALGCEYASRPTRSRPQPDFLWHGVAPALLQVALAGVWFAHIGAWRGAP
ncbi:MAG: hypothetical protein QM756_44575 [Polyangiaceae bacterium]